MKYFYSDPCLALLFYFDVVNRKEFCYEIGIPLIITSALGICLWQHYDVEVIKGILEAVLDLYAILVGFTITTISIFLTSDTNKIAVLNKKSGRTIREKEIPYYQLIHLLLIYSIIIGLLIIGAIVIVLILSDIVNDDTVKDIKIIKILYKGMFYLIIFGTFHNILLTIRNITNFYFIYFNKFEK